MTLSGGLLGLLAHVALQLLLMVRVLLRPHRSPASRAAWLVALAALPVAGILGYLLLGEVKLGRRRLERLQRVLEGLRQSGAAPGGQAAVPAPEPAASRDAALFRLSRSIGGFAPVGGNRGELLADSRASIDRLVEDIDRAREHVHLCFYIWLPDENGTRVARALMRAAARGVTCRALVDDLGSKLLLRSPLWREMGAGGVRLARALAIGNPLLRALTGRIDLRNHRKIVVIDHTITYCGSQNCADPEFRVKARYAPWVDAVMRFEGPVARQNQLLFAADWMCEVEEDLSGLLLQAPPPSPGPPEAGRCTVVGTGPNGRPQAAPELFQGLMYAAREELLITTPYYVPDEAMQAGLCAAARRGVDTRLVLPARNDSLFVAAASRSWYPELLAAGVRIHEYLQGLLHTKSVTVDGRLMLIGSANMDRRSFELNFENNILSDDPALTGALRARQLEYLQRCRPVSAAEVAAWPGYRRLWQNALAIMSPVL